MKKRQRAEPQALCAKDTFYNLSLKDLNSKPLRLTFWLIRLGYEPRGHR